MEPTLKVRAVVIADASLLLATVRFIQSHDKNKNEKNKKNNQRIHT